MLKQFTPVLATAGAVAFTVIAATTAQAVVLNQYLVDDGSTESAVGFSVTVDPNQRTCVKEETPLGDFIWLNDFDVLPGAEVIESVSISWAVPRINPCRNQPLVSIDRDANGKPKIAQFFLYQYNSDDTLTLLTEAKAKVELAPPDVFVDVKFNQAKQVSGRFFVGALYPGQLQGQFPAALDVPDPPFLAEGRSWIGFDNAYSPNQQPGSSIRFANQAVGSTISLSNFSPFHSGNWLLRANGRGVSVPPVKSVPESSPTIGLLGVGLLGIGALLKQKRHRSD